MKQFLTIAALLLISPVFAQLHESVFPNSNGDDLLKNLVSEFKPSNVLSLASAKDVAYSEVYNLNDSVRCVYTNHTLYLPEGVDPSKHLFMDYSPDGINLEHTFPRNKGAGNGNAENDLHHLFPVRSGINSSRGNLPFAEIPDNETETWYYLNFSQSSVPSSNIDLYSERIPGIFEPQESHKGNVARAMMYFYTMYKNEADSADSNFFDSQRVTLCNWHQVDPVDSLEWNRTFLIADYQDGMPNPFVLDSTLAIRAYCRLSTTKSITSNITEFNVYPNPADGELTINLTLKSSSNVRLTISDVAGKAIQTIEKRMTEGNHIIPFFLNSTGILIFRIETAAEVLSKKVIIKN